MARIGMPQPISHRRTGEDKVLTLAEMLKLYPQGNRYIFNPWLPGNLILANNILGITKLLGREGQGLIDPPQDYFEKMNESIAFNIEAIRQHRLEEQQADKAAAESARRTIKRKKTSRRNMTKDSQRRNR
jgi:hypothetical protein